MLSNMKGKLGFELNTKSYLTTQSKRIANFISGCKHVNGVIELFAGRLENGKYMEI